MNMMTLAAPALDRPLPTPTDAFAARTWPVICAAYLEAKAAEDAFCARYVDCLPPENVSQQAWEQAQLLLDCRFEAENVLMSIPSPDLMAFALKVNIAMADDREPMPKWQIVLTEESSRFLNFRQ